MDEELKSRLDTFVLKTTKKIEKKELIPEIQQEYDELIEFINKLAILTNDEFEKIEVYMNKYESELKQSKDQINSLILQNKYNEDKIKSLQDELAKNSSLEEQYKILNINYNILKEKNLVESDEISNYQNRLNKKKAFSIHKKKGTK